MKVRKEYLSRLKPVKRQKAYYRDTDEAQIENLEARQRYLQQYGNVENWIQNNIEKSNQCHNFLHVTIF